MNDSSSLSPPTEIKVYQAQRAGKNWKLSGPLKFSSTSQIDFENISERIFTPSKTKLSDLKAEYKDDRVCTFLYHLEAPGSIYQLVSDTPFNFKKVNNLGEIVKSDITGEYHKGWVTDLDKEEIDFVLEW